ncbi:DNA alkylation repair protein [Nakamurella alba]|uniref:DNA alkylation repair protein n=1 Tax=Nakamurella alba TaxID=2665158 RepID=UPI002AC34895|nr:DNA alkylation repair protein [Nakamurella alba]
MTPTSTPPAALARTIRERIRQEADPVLAPGMQAYMKSEMPFAGVRVPATRALTLAAAREVGLADPDAIAVAALDLWREAEVREERYAAQALLTLKPVRGRPDLLPVHREMIVDGAWWDHVDEASHRVGEVLLADPAGTRPEIMRWSASDDRWLRRAAIICQLDARTRTDTDLLEATISAAMDESEFFLRKGIGWALRQYARTDQGWVRDFLHRFDGRLSALSVREATKHF